MDEDLPGYAWDYYHSKKNFDCIDHRRGMLIIMSKGLLMPLFRPLSAAIWM